MEMSSPTSPLSNINCADAFDTDETNLKEHGVDHDIVQKEDRVNKVLSTDSTDIDQLVDVSMKIWRK